MGVTLTSMTPGSGVMLIASIRGSGGGPYPSITSGQVTAASTRAMRSTKSSTCSSGGRNRYKRPSRISATRAVAGAPSAGTTTAGAGDRWAPNSAGALSGSASADCGGGCQETASRGSRSPAGESPSVSTIRPRRSVQSALSQPSSPRCRGST
ncbi:Uncharacterised protein [Mycobacteroides abscessus subsp. abscessus]|nr:Uncharacterised protein [Mycobacteroides abscessus subsp. abscessus]